MRASSGSRGENDTGISPGCSSATHERCATCPWAGLRTEENVGLFDSAAGYMRRNIDWAARTATNGVHNKIVVPASE